ncbi:excalibur calcium-binding domain-containing protein [Deinococcus hopiensis]|uniref:Metal-dependent hydrolase, beta-lactamase superfamily II n=1 Tax=Deinococcus hopiensis KR-140 TaxID=695939 RepID=A0A1W1UH38_9DEIO|nr:excalibur calcium-binding domain-containing protein [Deinococcus hopiensis]SMB80121.1 Metal-dependent hydrolase, beta-lactamase superfamily II [Deinococcus hopiensis KR-140]
MRGFLALVALSTTLAAAQATPGVLTLRFLDVGQGDAVLITSPEGKSVLYDGGRSEVRLQTLLRQYGVQSLDLVAASHGDADHITGLTPAVRLYRPKLFLNNGIAANTQAWSKLVTAARNAGTQGLLAKDQVINLGSVKITVIPPPPGMPRGEQNVNSVGLLVQYGSFRALMTGDSETEETRAWLKKYPAGFLGPVQVYKSIHHGAKNGDNAAWLAAVRPLNVVIGVGPNNYGHPTAEALTLYKKEGAGVYRTDLQGTVTVVVQANGQFAITAEKGQAVAPNRGKGTAAPAKGPTTPAPYRSCAAARAAGVTPLRRGQPGYSAALDRDGDGVACE